MRQLAIIVFALFIGASQAGAASPETCAPGEQTDPLRLLRQLSLDVLGRIPTLDEYARVEAAGAVDPATIDALFASPEYQAEVRRYHRALVWGGLGDDVRVVGGTRGLAGTGLNTTPLFQAGMRGAYRGDGTYTCLNQLQTRFDATGRPVPIETVADPGCRGGFGGNGVCVREGYVMVRPYWSAVDLKVCAYDAQDLATGIGTPAPACNPYSTNRGCGCGANLRHCTTDRDGVNESIRNSLAEESVRIFDWVVREDRSYFEAFTTRKTFVNGPLRHFYASLSGASVPLRQNGAVGYDADVSTLPAIPFGEVDTWREITRGESHAGFTTTPGFLLRLASNRGRVNRFFTAFRCEPFVPLAEGLPPDLGGTPDPNLRSRAGCADCHEKLEPAAAHWGRWRTQSQYGHMNDVEVSFAAPLAECKACGSAGQPACSAFCNAYFITAANTTHPDQLAAWRGYPQAREYLSEPEALAADTGPAGLVDSPEERDRIATCTVRTLSQHLLGRALTDDEVVSWLPAAVAGFAGSGYKFAQLHRSLLDMPQYRTNR